MAREETTIYRFIVADKGKTLADFAEIEDAARRTAEAMRQTAASGPGGGRGGSQHESGPPAGVITRNDLLPGAGERFSPLPPVPPPTGALTTTSTARVGTDAQRAIEQMVASHIAAFQSAMEQAIRKVASQTTPIRGGSEIGQSVIEPHQPTGVLPHLNSESRNLGSGLGQAAQTLPLISEESRQAGQGLIQPGIEPIQPPTGLPQPGIEPQQENRGQPQYDFSAWRSALPHAGQGTPPPSNVVPPTQGIPPQAENEIPQPGSDLRQSDLYEIPVSQIRAVPEQVQFRSRATRPGGVTNKLEGITQFDKGQAGISTLMADPENPGGYVVIDAHHRLAKAKELIAQGREPEDLTLTSRISPVTTFAEARKVGAELNIFGGTAKSYDVAHYIRESGLTADQFLADPRLGKNTPGVQEGAAISRLAKPIYDEYERGRLSEKRAIGLGNLKVDPAAQEQIYRSIRELEGNRGRALNDDEYETYLRRARNVGTVNSAQAGLFGEETTTRSLLNERVEIEGGTLSRLRANKTALGRLGNEQVIALGQQAGVVGNVDSAQARELAKQAGQVVDVVQKLADTSGTVVDQLLNKGAQQLAGGGSKDEIIGNVIKALSDPETLKGAVRNAFGGGSADLPDVTSTATPPVEPPSVIGAGGRRGGGGRRPPKPPAGFESQEEYDDYHRGYQERLRQQNAERKAKKDAELAEIQARIDADNARQADEPQPPPPPPPANQVSVDDLREQYRTGTPALRRDLANAFGIGTFVNEQGTAIGGKGDPFDSSTAGVDTPIDKQRSSTLIKANDSLQRQIQRGTSRIADLFIRGDETAGQRELAINAGRAAIGDLSISRREQLSRVRGGLGAARRAQNIEAADELQGFLDAPRDLARQRRESIAENRRQDRAEASVDRQRSTATLQEEGSRRVGALDPQDFELRSSRLRVLQLQQSGLRGQLDAALRSGGQARDPEVVAISTQLNAVSKELEKTAALGKMGFGVPQGGLVGGLQAASFKAFPFTIGAFAVQSGAAPVQAASAQFAQAYKQYGPFNPEQTAANIDLVRTQARLGAQGAVVNTNLTRAGNAILSATEPVGGGAVATGLGVAGSVISQGLNVAGLAVALRELTNVALKATAGLGGFAGVVAALGRASGLGVGAAAAASAAGAAGAAGAGATGAAAASAGGVGLAAAGTGVAGAAVGAGLGGLLGPAAVVGALSVPFFAPKGLPGAPVEPERQENVSRTYTSLYDRVRESPTPLGFLLSKIEPIREASRTEARVQQTQNTVALDQAKSAIASATSDPRFAEFEASRRREDELSGLGGRAYEFIQARRQQAPSLVSIAQQERDINLGVQEDTRATERLERNQVFERTQFARAATRQREDIEIGQSRRVRDIGIGAGRARRDLGIQYSDQIEDIGIGEQEQRQDIGRNLGRSIRDIGIGVAESRQQIGRGLERTERDINIDATRGKEDIDRQYGRGFQDVILGQIGGLGGQFLRLGISRKRALEDADRRTSESKEDAQRRAGDAYSDVDVGAGQAEARARLAAGDAAGDAGTQADRARAGAGRALARGQRSVEQSTADATEDASTAFKDAIDDLNKRITQGTADMEDAQKRERKALEDDLAVRAVLRQNQINDLKYQSEIIKNLTGSIEKTDEIYADWLKSLKDMSKETAAVSTAMKLNYARIVGGS